MVLSVKSIVEGNCRSYTFSDKIVIFSLHTSPQVSIPSGNAKHDSHSNPSQPIPPSLTTHSFSTNYTLLYNGCGGSSATLLLR